MNQRITSSQKYFGLPLYDVVYGADQGDFPCAKGILAIGPRACGFVALGIFSCGIFSAGVCSLGLLSLGVFALGLISLGVFSLAAFLAVGVVAIGIYSIGVAAIGVTSAGVTTNSVNQWFEISSTGKGSTPLTGWQLYYLCAIILLNAVICSASFLLKRPSSMEPWKNQQQPPLSPDEVKSIKSYQNRNKLAWFILAILILLVILQAIFYSADSAVFLIYIWVVFFMGQAFLTGHCPRCRFNLGFVRWPPFMTIKCPRCRVKLRE